jgi:E3 ubiquitin-protein ligase RBBP6
MSIHYKFKSSTTSDTVKFDGLHISVSELKSAICQQKKLGKGKDSELQIRDADTLELYGDDAALIPKNTSLIVQRVPNPHYSKHGRGGGAGNGPGDDGAPFDPTLGGAGLPDPRVFRGELTTDDPDATEEDKIRAMMIQSTQDYDPSR